MTSNLASEMIAEHALRLRRDARDETVRKMQDDVTEEISEKVTISRQVSSFM